MKSIGRPCAILLCTLLALGSSLAGAEINAALDRNRIAFGDSVRLTLTATEGESLDNTDVNALTTDFDILQRSSSSNTQIVNGNLSRTRQLILDLSPKREGALQIPALQIDSNSTAAIPLLVEAPSNASAEGAQVLFEATVDQDSVYVQGQIILTLRVQQAINLERRSLSELTLDNAFVKPLEQRSFRRTLDGRQWLVDEVRYAVFPEQSGTLEIPAQVFSGRLSDPRRSFFDPGRGGQLVRRSTLPITIEVLPKPASFTGASWLPVRNLTLQETWSQPPSALTVGESVTRTIKMTGEGALGAQLPPILFTPIDGLKYYPDQPQISEQEIPSGLLGVRQDSAAIVATRAGTYIIPETRIAWWNVATKQTEYAVLPAREVTVQAGVSVDAATPPAPAPATLNPPTAAQSLPNMTASVQWLWPAIAAVCAFGWLCTGMFLWRRRQAPNAAPAPATATPVQSNNVKQLITRCQTGTPPQARAAVLQWAALHYQDPPPVSLEQVAALARDPALSDELSLLDATLYGQGADSWSGATLAECLRRLHSTINTKQTAQHPSVQLYPSDSQS